MPICAPPHRSKDETGVMIRTIIAKIIFYTNRGRESRPERDGNPTGSAQEESKSRPETHPRSGWVIESDFGFHGVSIRLAAKGKHLGK